MPQGAVPRRYAEAMFTLARDQGKLDRWRQDLLVAAGVLGNPRLLARLDDPNFGMAEKRQLIDAVLTVQVEPDVRKVIYMLTERGRIGSFQRVVDEFVACDDKGLG